MTRRGILQGLTALLAWVQGCGRSGFTSSPRYLKNGVFCSDQGGIYRWQVKMRQVLASRTPHLGYGNCDSCKLPWWVVDGHDVPYEGGSSCFPVCEMCWKNLGPEGALPYYENWIRKNYPGDEEKLERVRHEIVGKGYWQVK